jgi:hypothetical protein
MLGMINTNRLLKRNNALLMAKIEILPDINKTFNKSQLGLLEYRFTHLSKVSRAKRHLLLMHYLLSTLIITPTKLLQLTLGEIGFLLERREYSMAVRYKPHESSNIRVSYLSKQDQQLYEDSYSNNAALQNLGYAIIRKGVDPDMIKGIFESLHIISPD